MTSEDIVAVCRLIVRAGALAIMLLALAALLAAWLRGALHARRQRRVEAWIDGALEQHLADGSYPEARSDWQHMALRRLRARLGGGDG